MSPMGSHARLFEKVFLGWLEEEQPVTVVREKRGGMERLELHPREVDEGDLVLWGNHTFQVAVVSRAHRARFHTFREVARA